MCHYGAGVLDKLHEVVCAAFADEVNAITNEPFTPSTLKYYVEKWIKDAAGPAGNGPGRQAKRAKRAGDLISVFGAGVDAEAAQNTGM